MEQTMDELIIKRAAVSALKAGNEKCGQAAAESGHTPLDAVSVIESLPQAQYSGWCEGCIYPAGEGVHCTLCARNYPDRYKRKEGEKR